MPSDFVRVAAPTGSAAFNIQFAATTIHRLIHWFRPNNFEDLEGEKKANLEAHLKGTVEGQEGDFFNVNKYPTATFELTGAEAMGDHTMVKGNLTIKDQTNHIEFPANITMDADKVTIESKTFSIDRTKWNVNYGSKSVFDNLGDKFINDEIELTISLVAKK